MRQIFEGIFKITIGNLFHYRNQTSNSHNRIENNYYSLVNFNSKLSKRRSYKIKSLPPEMKKIGKF